MVVATTRTLAALITQREAQRGTKGNSLAIGELVDIVWAFIKLAHSSKAASVIVGANVSDARAATLIAALRSDLLPKVVKSRHQLVPTRLQTV